MESNKKKPKYFTSAEKIILLTGIFLFIFSFISELHFHYIQGFMLENIPEDIFWRAEAAEVLNSMTFLLLGIGLIIVAFILSKKRRKKK
jgi:LPXTG-motif cell wall-anchored protein